MDTPQLEVEQADGPFTARIHHEVPQRRISVRDTERPRAHAREEPRTQAVERVRTVGPHGIAVPQRSQCRRGLIESERDERLVPVGHEIPTAERCIVPAPRRLANTRSASAYRCRCDSSGPW